MDDHENLHEEPVTEPVPAVEPAATGQRTLHRSTTKKVFGGVAGGIAERFDVDANIVRVVFVVLALVYGLGIAIYLAMWALIPRGTSTGDEVVVDEETTEHRHWLRYALPLGVVVLIIVVLTTLHGLARWGKGFTLLWLIFLFVLAVIALGTPARRLTLRRFVALSFLGGVSFLILVIGVFLISIQVIGVPVEGGSGVKEWSPVTTAQILPAYHGAYGQSTIDLLNVPFPAGTWTITATQGVGVLIIDVPRNVSVALRTHVGIGGIFHDFYYDGLGSTVSTATSSKSAHLVLDLQVGIGKIELRGVGRRTQ